MARAAAPSPVVSRPFVTAIDPRRWNTEQDYRIAALLPVAGRAMAPFYGSFAPPDVLAAAVMRNVFSFVISRTDLPTGAEPDRPDAGAQLAHAMASVLFEADTVAKAWAMVLPEFRRRVSGYRYVRAVR